MLREKEDRQTTVMAEPSPSPPPGVAAAASPKAQRSNEEWVKRLEAEDGWHTKDTAQDAYTGQQVLEWVAKYETVKENETIKQIAIRFELETSELVKYNNERWFGGKLKENSKLRAGTRMLLPQPRPGDGMEGEVVATNYVLWTVKHGDGDVVDLNATEIRAARWNYRVVAEKWQTMGTANSFIDDRIRREYPVEGQAYSVNGTIVGYLPPGEEADDFAMWHVMHDDGDDEDLEQDEVVQGSLLFKEWTDGGGPARDAAAAAAAAAASAAAAAAAKKKITKSPKKMSVSALVTPFTHPTAGSY